MPRSSIARRYETTRQSPTPFWPLRPAACDGRADRLPGADVLLVPGQAGVFRGDFLGATPRAGRAGLAAAHLRLRTAGRQPALGVLFLVPVLLDGHGVGKHLGAFRYNVFLLVGWLATVAVSFLQPDAPASIVFLQGSVFLAFAYLYPDFQLLLFFILPVKVKWLALLQWIAYFLVILFGSLIAKVLATASICNFLLFFWRDILLRMRAGRWRMSQQARQIRAAPRPVTPA